MKREQTQEKDRNLKILKYLNKKERERQRDIKTQHTAERLNKNFVSKIMVNRTIHNNRMKKEDTRFINNFTHAKNIIEKQMFKGKMIKEKRNFELENRKKKEFVKQARSFIGHQAIPNKVFDSAVNHPMLFNSFIDPNNDNDTHSSTMYNEDHANEPQGTSTVYGKNFVEFPQYATQERTFDLRGRSQGTDRISGVRGKHLITRKSTSYIKSRLQNKNPRHQVFNKKNVTSSKLIKYM
jgi:hypothetical protein